MRPWWMVVVILAAGCSSGPEDGVDAGTDSGSDSDSGSEVPLDGYGEIGGLCGELDDEEWNSTDPFLFRNAIDFDTIAFDPDLLSQGGQKIWEDGNLGGTSIHSEIIAYEVLYRCELADLVKTEKEITYQDADGKKTDFLAFIDEHKVGVSVTRAFHFPPENPYTVTEARTLLEDKLGDILLSAANAEPENAWSRSILHVIAYDHPCADSVVTAFGRIDPAVKADTILLLTVTDGDDDFVY